MENKIENQNRWGTTKFDYKKYTRGKFDWFESCVYVVRNQQNRVWQAAHGTESFAYREALEKTWHGDSLR